MGFSPWGRRESDTTKRLSTGVRADRRPAFHINLELVPLRTALPQVFCGKSICTIKNEI